MKHQSHEDILNQYHEMKQHIEKPTRKGTKLIDHFSSNLDKIIAKDVLPCDEIKDHDAPYVILNIQKQIYYLDLYKDFNQGIQKSETKRTLKSTLSGLMLPDFPLLPLLNVRTRNSTSSTICSCPV